MGRVICRREGEREVVVLKEGERGSMILEIVQNIARGRLNSKWAVRVRG